MKRLPDKKAYFSLHFLGIVPSGLAEVISSKAHNCWLPLKATPSLGNSSCSWYPLDRTMVKGKYEGSTKTTFLKPGKKFMRKTHNHDLQLAQMREKESLAKPQHCNISYLAFLVRNCALSQLKKANAKGKKLERAETTVSYTGLERSVTFKQQPTCRL